MYTEDEIKALDNKNNFMTGELTSMKDNYNNLEITEIKIRKYFANPDSALKGIISITFNNSLIIHDIRVIYTDERKFLAMPSRKDETDIFRDIVFPLNSELRDFMEKVAFEAFERYISAVQLAEVF